MAFHVRLVSPPDQTERLVGLLAGDSGVSNLVVLPGMARRPDGDAVQFDVTVLIVVGTLMLRLQRIIWRVRAGTAGPRKHTPA